MACGDNYGGQLGDGTFDDRSTPVQVANLSNVVAIAGCRYHNLALKSDGTVMAWGHNSSGELGDGTRTSRSTPVQVANLSGVVAIAVGGYHSLALKSDGTVWTWGQGRSTPVQVANLSGVVAIASGDGHSLALKSDGTVMAWGRNNYGQLGDGTFTPRATPVQVANLSGVVAIAGGRVHSLALKSDGTVMAWGSNNADGRLGDGTTFGSRPTPVQVANLSGVVAIADGDDHSLALKSDGTVMAWGSNNYGQLGDGTFTPRATPGPVLDASGAPLSGITSIAAGFDHSLALKVDIAAGIIIPVDPRETFYSTFRDFSAWDPSYLYARPSVPIDLASLGLKGGDEINLTRLGGFYQTLPVFAGGWWANPYAVTAMVGVFSSTGEIITDNDSQQPQRVNRIPGALYAGEDYLAGDLMDWSTNPPTLLARREIPEDFRISYWNAEPAISQGRNITIPPGARFLFLSTGDGTVSDNLAWENGYALRITALRAPVARADTYSTAEETRLTVAAPGVLGNDTDANGDALRARLVSGTANGTVTLNANGAFTYTPNPNYNGPDSFTYKANDGTADSNVATVTITVTPVNDAPVADGQSVQTNEDTAKNITLTGSDVDGNNLTYTLVTGPTNGTLSGEGANRTYTPKANFNGTDSFTYKANDGTADSNVATVTITINSINDAPDAVDDPNASTTVNQAVTVSVLANDTDVDGDTLSVAAVTQPTNGSVTFTGTSVTYTPRRGYKGTDTFTYTVSDGNGGSDTAQVTVTVAAGVPNRSPVAMPDSANAQANFENDIRVLANDTDPDPGDAANLIITNVTTPMYPGGRAEAGVATIAADKKSIKFIPYPGEARGVTFQYTISDQRGGTSTARVTVNVMDGG